MFFERVWILLQKLPDQSLQRLREGAAPVSGLRSGQVHEGLSCGQALGVEASEGVEAARPVHALYAAAASQSNECLEAGQVSVLRCLWSA